VNRIEPTPSAIFRSRSFFAASLGYLAFLCLLFWPLFTGDSLNAGAQRWRDAPFFNANSGKAIPYINSWDQDFIEQFSMFEEYQYRSAKQGRFPTWNPYILTGQPFHGNGQSAMLFPTHWIYFLLNPDFARGPMAMLRLWVSAMAMFSLLQKLGLSPIAAFVGGSVWAFGSFNMHWLPWPHTNASLSAPVALLGLDYLLLSPSLRRFAAASLCITPLFLAGHPGTEYLCGELIAIYCIVRLVGRALTGVPLRSLMIAACSAVAAIAAALLTAAAALWPLFLQIRRSFEYLDPAGHRGGMPPLSWSALWLFLVPEYFGRPRAAFVSYVDLPPDNYMESALWFGAIAFLLALAGIYGAFSQRTIDRNQPWRNRFSFPAIFGIIVFALSLGVVFSIWPISQIANALPGSQLTNLRRVLFATQFAGAMLAACTVHQILIKKDLKVAIFAALLCVTGSILALDALVGQWPKFEQNWAQSLQLAARQHPDWPTLMHSMFVQFAGYRILAGAIILVLGTVLLLLIVLLTIRRRAVPPGLQYLFAAIITLDVLLPAYEFTPIAPLQIASPPAPPILASMIHQIGDGRMLGVDGMLDPNLSMHFGFRDIRGYDLPHDRRQVDLFKRLHVDDAFLTGEIKFRQLYPVIQPEISAYLDRACVRAVMLQCPDAQVAAGLSSLKQDPSIDEKDWPLVASAPDRVMVFANPNAYPRTFLAEDAEPATSAGEAMNALLNPSVDLRHHSVYESAHALEPLHSTESDATRIARITVDDPERIVIDTQARDEHLLDLDDRMADRWRVTVDGKPAEPLIANYLFRGVIVPAGHHTVEWTYHAPGLAAGFGISIGALAALIGLLLWPCGRSRKQSEAVACVVAV
jgi:hypothetical protein